MNGFRLLIVGVCSCAALAGFAQAPPAAARWYHFREPQKRNYRVEADGIPASLAKARRDWVKAWPEGGSRFPVEFGSRVGLQLRSGTNLRELIMDRPLTLARVVAPDLF